MDLVGESPVYCSAAVTGIMFLNIQETTMHGPKCVCVCVDRCGDVGSVWVGVFGVGGLIHGCMFCLIDEFGAPYSL